MKLSTPHVFDHYKITKEKSRWFLTGFIRKSNASGPKEGPFKTATLAVQKASDVGKICMSV